jgi:CRP-like cAMP-binding protein
MSHEAVAAALRRSDIFASLDATELDRLAGACRVRRLARDETVFSRGDTGGGLYLVAQGSVSLSMTSADGGEVVLAVVVPPQTFGELGVIDGGARVATATTRQPSVLVCVPRAEMRRVISSQPVIAVALLSTLTTLVRRLDEHTSDLVLGAAQVTPADVRPGVSVPVDPRLSQTELARLIGGSRQQVNRMIATLEARGAIRRQGRRIVSVRPDLLVAG